MSVPEYPIGTKEYVKFVFTSDRTLDTQPVEIKVNGTWLPATWLGTAGLTRTARTSSVVDFAGATQGYQTIYGRFTDSPEIPIIDGGKILITAN
jgi:hypothetical protein